MTLKVLPKKVFKCFVVLNLFWVLFSTVVPSFAKNDLFTLSPQLSAENNQLVNSDIYFVIAHPDDEVMFFAPSIIELAKKQYNNTLSLVCFSNGDADGLGAIRAEEVIDSARIFGIKSDDVHQIIDDFKFKDGMNITWDKIDISSELDQIIKIMDRPINLITFDENGVSNHPNHISLFYGCKSYMESHKNVNVFKLNSMSFFEKYSGTIITSKLILTKYLKSIGKVLYDKDVASDWVLPHLSDNLPERVIRFYSDFPCVILTIGIMSFAHHSQMVWFRWGWLMLSRFVNFNELTRV